MRPSASSRLRSIAVEDPDRPAIVARDRSWTYAELDAAVEQHAAWFYARRRAGALGIVALRYRQTVPLIISSLALSRSGGVCALIDPLAPAARIRLVLDDLGRDGPAPLLITDQADDQAEYDGSVLFADVGGVAEAPVLTAEAELDPDEMQNVIYTSGSTGVPIGLCISGRQREAIDAWARTFDAFRDGVRVGAISAGTLGQSAEFPRIVIATGGTILVHDVLADGLNGIPRWLREQRVEAIGLVPTLIRFLLPLLDDELGPDGVLSDLNTVAVWGESSDWADVVRLGRHLPDTAVVHNAYAATETGMIAALSLDRAEITGAAGRGGPLPAGRPLPGVDVRLLDADGRDVPPGMTGEIAVSSPHLALGHWHRPELTASALVDLGASRPFWRTGDGGRLDDDGLLYVEGRLDNVVKISGHRVALGELEHAARQQHGVAGAAAAGRTDAHDAVRLHLWVVPEPGATLDPRWLRAALARALPPSSLPDTIDIVESLPRLSNGKIDRKSLPEPSRGSVQPPAANTAFVERLVELYREVLGIEAVGVNDDFFELGGDSVRAGRLVGALQSRFGHFVPASLLLEASTPASLAAALSSAGDAVLVPVRTAGSGVPLFVVHGASGEVLFARALAEHLDTNQPVYALQPPPLRGPVPFVPTLADMAGRYIDHVRRVWPNGPYRIFGFSMGGIVAFEMATLLQEAGEKVELLALGDTQAPEIMEPVWRDQTARRERELAARSMPAKVRDQLAHRGRQLRRRLARLPLRTVQWRAFLAGAEPQPEIRADAYLHVYGRLAYEHRIARRFHGDATLVIAGRSDGPTDRGWSSHVDGDLRLVVLDARHEELIVEPVIGDLGRALSVPRMS